MSSRAVAVTTLPFCLAPNAIAERVPRGALTNQSRARASSSGIVSTVRPPLAGPGLMTEIVWSPSTEICVIVSLSTLPVGPVLSHSALTIFSPVSSAAQETSASVRNEMPSFVETG